jgi:4-hydroxy-2-oxoglutarate aldolase
LANIAPQQCIEIHQLFLEGKMEIARKLQNSLIELNAMVTREQGVPALKAAMDMLSIYGGPCREPILPVSEAIKNSIADLLNDLNN